MLKVEWDGAVGIATGYGLDGRGVAVRVPVGARFPPGRFWGPPSLISNGYGGLFTWGYSGRGVKMTIHLQLVPRLRIRESMHPLPIRLHGIVHNFTYSLIVI
jgi:hypothetical protein